MDRTKAVPELLLELDGFPLPDFFDEFADDERIGFVSFGSFLKFVFYVPDPCWMARVIFDQTLREQVGAKFNKVTSRQSSHDVCSYWRNSPKGTRIARRRQMIGFSDYVVERRADGSLCANLSVSSGVMNVGHIVSASDMLKEWKWAHDRNGDR